MTRFLTLGSRSPRRCAVAVATATIVAVATLAVHAGIASAVSYPDGEISGNKVPYVVNILSVKSPGNWSGKTIDICTGTFIYPGYVITAAHCVEGQKAENLYVGVGTNRSSLRYCGVLGLEDHPRYTKGRISVNDIALLRVTSGCNPRKYPRIPGKSTTHRAMYLYGWGLNQDSEASTELGKLKVNDYSAMAQDLYGSAFNPAIQIAAGRWFAREEIFGGACRGDSGGPLIAQSGGKATLVGVVSWGGIFGRSCQLPGPTVFADMGAYSRWIFPASNRISRMIRATDYSYSRRAPNLNPADGVDFYAGQFDTNSKVTLIRWVYTETAAPSGPVAWGVTMDPTFDGSPELVGNDTQISDQKTGKACAAQSITTEPVEGSPGSFSHTARFSTPCLWQFLEFASIQLSVTAGGMSESVTIYAAVVPPDS